MVVESVKARPQVVAKPSRIFHELALRFIKAAKPSYPRGLIWKRPGPDWTELRRDSG